MTTNAKPALRTASRAVRSQGQLPEMIGLTQPAMARLEWGEETPTLKTPAEVSNATGLELRVDVACGTATLVAA